MEVIPFQPEASRFRASVKRKLGKGTRQSPVDIIPRACGSLRSDSSDEEEDAVFRMKIFSVRGMIDFSDSTHNVTVMVPPGNSIAHAGKQFELLELHFHSPSEHTLNGVRHSMELHLVHMAADTTKLVFAVFFEVGDHEDAFLKSLFSRSLPKRHHAQPIHRRIDLPKLLSVEEEAIFTYPGSLTTPPYSEDVTWCVSERVHEASASQLAKFRRSVPSDNNREIQTLEGRHVLRSTCRISQAGAHEREACCSIV